MLLFDTDNLLRFTKLVKCIPGFFFTVFLKNRNISSEIKLSKVTEYAALTCLREVPILTRGVIVEYHYLIQ